MRYKIVTGRNTNDLSISVNYAISQGWIPQGGVNISGMNYSQAMIQMEG